MKWQKLTCVLLMSMCIRNYTINETDSFVIINDFIYINNNFNFFFSY